MILVTDFFHIIDFVPAKSKSGKGGEGEEKRNANKSSFKRETRVQVKFPGFPEKIRKSGNRSEKARRTLLSVR